jgi:hypothetical protein
MWCHLADMFALGLTHPMCRRVQVHSKPVTLFIVLCLAADVILTLTEASPPLRYRS